MSGNIEICQEMSETCRPGNVRHASGKSPYISRHLPTTGTVGKMSVTQISFSNDDI